jgi:hypothetical protein
VVFSKLTYLIFACSKKVTGVLQWNSIAKSLDEARTSNETLLKIGINQKYTF